MEILYNILLTVWFGTMVFETIGFIIYIFGYRYRKNFKHTLKVTTELYQYLRDTDEEFNEEMKSVEKDLNHSDKLKLQRESDKLEILYEIGSY